MTETQELNFYQKLNLLQLELKAPKAQYNNFGKYKYRSCEDILDSVKSLLKKYGFVLLVSDELKEASGRLEKLLLSAIANWESKNEGSKIEDSNLFVKEITVDSGRMLKRVQPAPQGRAHRIRKRSNHVTIVVAAKNAE